MIFSLMITLIAFTNTLEVDSKKKKRIISAINKKLTQQEIIFLIYSTYASLFIRRSYTINACTKTKLYQIEHSMMSKSYAKLISFFLSTS